MMTRLQIFAALILTSCSFVTLFSAPGIAGDASAQTWKIAYSWPSSDGYISAMHFFNTQVGIIGWHWNVTTTHVGMVMRTTDGGQSWTNCTIGPGLSTNNTPTVTDIWFLTPDSGWMTIAGSLNAGDPVLWRTVDSGKTWTSTWNGMSSPYNFYSGLASVWQTDSTLVVSAAHGVGLWTSIDTGRTWPWAQPTLWENGLAFQYEIGVATSDNINATTNFLTTTDGGRTWLNANSGIPHEGWGLHEIERSSGVFVAAPEDVTTLSGVPQSYIDRSTNFGIGWSRVLKLPINTTGDIEGVQGILYVQSSGGIAGVPPIDNLMESTDAGFTWTGVGGPQQSSAGGANYRGVDTRFAVTGCGNIVYASDNSDDQLSLSSLWKTVDAPGLMVTDIDTMRPASAIICDTTVQQYYLHNLNSSQITIESIQILDSTRRPAKTHAVWLDSIPGPFTDIFSDDSASFELAWHPGAMMDSAATDSATIRVIFYASYLTPCVSAPQLAYDTVLLHVKLHGLSVPAEYALSANTIKTDTLLTCMSLDTTLDIINQGCDSIAITKALLAKNAWSVTDLAGNKLKLPIHLGSGDTLRLELHATPTSTAVLYDSLKVTMHYMGNDTLWGAALRTYVKLNAAQPALATQAKLAFDSLAICDSTDELVTLTNTGCDTLSINKFDLTDTHFELLDTNGKPLALPLKLDTNSSRQVKVRFIPGTLGNKTATLRLHYLRSLYSAFDSSNVIQLSGTGAASGTVTFADSIDFGNVSICSSPAIDTLFFRNTSCDPAFIESISIPPPFILLDSAKLSSAIGSGGVLMLRVLYQPGAKVHDSGDAVVRVLINNGQTTLTGTIHFSGNGTAGSSTFETNPPLTATTFAFGTLSECDHADSVTFTVYNTGCDTLHVTGLTLDPSLQGTFAGFADKPLPALLGKGDSLHVTLAITALITNTYAGNFHIQYTLADGSTHDLTMPVSLIVSAQSGTSALTMSTPTSFDFKTIHACSIPTADTTIAISNTGCGTDTVIVSLAGNGFTLGPKLDTILITPGSTAKVTVYYDDTSRGALNAIATLQTNVKNNNFTSIQLIGNVPPVDTVHFKVAFSKMPVASGEGFTVSLLPDIVVSGTGLQAIHGVFEYRSNDFEVFKNSMTSNLTLSQNGPTRVGSVEQYSFDVTNPNDISLDPSTPVVTLPMIAMVSDSVGGMISVDSLALNHGDPTFSNCQLASSTFASDASLAIRCGDSTLIYYLDGKPLVTAEGLRPNPVTNENGYQTTLDLSVAEDGTALIALYDGLGREVSHDVLTLTHGQPEPYTFDLKNLPAGSYYYQLRFTGTTASGSAKGMLLLEK